MSNPTPALAVQHLGKVYRNWRRTLVALVDVDLEVEPGEVFGLLGANGAGKTTLIKILLGLTRASSGTVALRGHDPRSAAARRRVGYLPEGHRFPGYLTGEGALRLFGRLAGVDEAVLKQRIPELLALVGLPERGRDRISRYSKGMTQRLGLAAALVDDPDILFLDEPTDGVDPVGRRHIRDVLLGLRQRGTTVFINSHLLSEVERTCDRVGILDRGRLVREGNVEQLTRRGHRYRVQLAGDPPAPWPELATQGATAISHNGSVELEVDSLATLNAVLDELRARSLLITEVSPLRTALEDVFVATVSPGEGGR